MSGWLGWISGWQSHGQDDEVTPALQLVRGGLGGRDWVGPWAARLREFRAAGRGRRGPSGGEARRPLPRDPGASVSASSGQVLPARGLVLTLRRTTRETSFTQGAPCIVSKTIKTNAVLLFNRASIATNSHAMHSTDAVKSASTVSQRHDRSFDTIFQRTQRSEPGTNLKWQIHPGGSHLMSTFP